MAVEISLSDIVELSSLREHLARVPGVEVRQVGVPPMPGEQGAWDFLQVAAAGGGALVVAIKTIPEFLPMRMSPEDSRIHP
ncbi:hypothetical protein ACIHDR_19000 [Nocardia sp. NPDC052278]|uniref:effector-associated constant component EACC1 n=1 Tax=unclassified Nocardia TaxID=2637762 RepID=UPI0036805E3B